MGDYVTNVASIISSGLAMVSISWGLVFSLEQLQERSLRDFQTIEGTVLEGQFVDSFFRDKYLLTVETDQGRRVVNFNAWYCADQEPQFLAGYFMVGDQVELGVALNSEFDGQKGYVGLTGRLLEE